MPAGGAVSGGRSAITATGAGADRGSDELHPVGLATRDGNEHVAGLDRAAVGGHAADIEIGGAMLALGVGRQDLA